VHNPEEDSSFIQCVVQSTPFIEKHMVENLFVGPEKPNMNVIFYQMLNQGAKRGK
jgi:hypothetical protein